MAPKTTGRRRLPAWVGPWLRTTRTIDTETIAKRLRRSTSAVSRIETGLAIISADDLPFVLKAYSLTLEQFTEAARRAPKAA